MDESVFQLVRIVGFILQIFLCIWGYNDAIKRGRSGILVALLLFFLSILGWILWLILRPSIKQE